jgi:hypothetical protein
MTDTGGKGIGSKLYLGAGDFWNMFEYHGPV